MPVQLSCPTRTCVRTCRAPDAAVGKTLKCPGCGQPFTAKPTAAVTPSVARESTADGSTNPARTAASTHPLQSVGRFVVRAKLVEGAFGAAYWVYDPQLDREVALKVPHAAVLDSPKRVGRSLREAKAARWMRKNPAVSGPAAAGVLVAVGIAVLAAHAVAGRNEAKGAKGEAVEAKARQSVVVLECGVRVRLAHQTDPEKNPEATRLEVNDPDAKLRHREWQSLNRFCDTSLTGRKGHTDTATAAAFSPDGTRVVTASVDELPRVWDRRSLSLPPQIPEK